MKTLSNLLMGVVIVLAGATVLAADVPSGKETLKIDLVDGKKGAVEFQHAKHTTTYKKKDGSKIECVDCHHTIKGDEKAKACSTCHVKVGEAEKDVGGKKAPALAAMKGDKVNTKSVIFHTRCKDACHKEIGKTAEGVKLTSCKTCHKK